MGFLEFSQWFFLLNVFYFSCVLADAKVAMSNLLRRGPSVFRDKRNSRHFKDSSPDIAILRRVFGWSVILRVNSAVYVR